MKKLTILSLCFLCIGLLPAAPIIDSSGDFAPFTRCKLEVRTVGSSSLSFKISCAWKTIWVTHGPEKPIAIHGKWFLYPESETRVWFYDGDESLVLYQIGYFGGGAFELGRTDAWLVDQIPEEVAVRLSEKLVRRIEAEKKE